MKNSLSKQDYLKAIFTLCLTDDKKTVKVGELSKRLDISPAAVTEMTGKLVDDGMVTSAPYKGLTLTKKGIAFGKNMMRRHRLWETYLCQELNFPADKVHDEAERLEHACSDELINIIDEKLGFPKKDPHDNPIPDRNGNIPA